jgi:fluoride ion exporter CrcB/FEX
MPSSVATFTSVVIRRSTCFSVCAAVLLAATFLATATSQTAKAADDDPPLNLARDGQLLRAGSNVVLSLLLCLSAVALGFSVGAKAFGVIAT